MKIECEREQDVLDALAAQRWPARCGDDLRAHVGGCAICADLVAVARALLEDHDNAYDHARVPASGLVWWRAQLRAREEAARAAGRPIAFVQGVAATAIVWLLAALIRAGYVPHVTLPAIDFARLASGVPVNLVWVALATLIAAPLAIYFAIAED